MALFSPSDFKIIPKNLASRKVSSGSYPVRVTKSFIMYIYYVLQSKLYFIA